MRLIPMLAGLLLASPALAQNAPGAPAATPATGQRPAQPVANIIVEPVAMMIAAFDTDGDARVTRAEFDAGVTRSFASADRENSGSIGYIRYAEWALTWLGDRNALPGPFEVDTNGDNRITLDELRARFALLFTRFDADKDGVLIRSELVTIRTPQLQMERGQRRREDSQRPPQ
ncbi:EF-hand domain-containing protein [Sphingomonas sp. AOB5]|uniref:EF-hand domain-containing protein n=1 Tax=Sphingomonas sp. AOB5 TaxID=3034017 RepID=UPI0023F8CC80|nr:EF-hand domain-containing protein [Sphingomonas sp. AOB5]MDF7776292.1 EF-hand domain-containing protein [Sphingomonas sp. AOB5]